MVCFRWILCNKPEIRNINTMECLCEIWMDISKASFSQILRTSRTLTIFLYGIVCSECSECSFMREIFSLTREKFWTFCSTDCKRAYLHLFCEHQSNHYIWTCVVPEAIRARSYSRLGVDKCINWTKMCWCVLFPSETLSFKYLPPLSLSLSLSMSRRRRLNLFILFI